VSGDALYMEHLKHGVIPITDDIKFDIYEESEVKFTNRKRFYIFYGVIGALITLDVLILVW
jgi:hypothetical protein